MGAHGCTAAGPDAIQQPPDASSSHTKGRNATHTPQASIPRWWCFCCMQTCPGEAHQPPAILGSLAQQATNMLCVQGGADTAGACCSSSISTTQTTTPPACVVAWAAPPSRPVRPLPVSSRFSSAAIPDQAAGSRPLKVLLNRRHNISLERAPQEGGRVPVRVLLYSCRSPSAAILDQAPGSGPLRVLLNRYNPHSLDRAPQEGGRVPAGHTHTAVSGYASTWWAAGWGW
jgi:hypothetical protein